MSVAGLFILTAIAILSRSLEFKPLSGKCLAKLPGGEYHYHFGIDHTHKYDDKYPGNKA